MENNLLSIDEKKEFDRCELVIKQGLETFIEVGQALLKIREKRLYRLEFSTFEDYCRHRWGMARQRAHQMIEAANVVKELSTIVDILPKTESQARPLTQFQPEVQREAWKEVIQQSQITGEPITSQKVKEVVDTFKQAKENYRELRQKQKTDILEKKTDGITIPIDQANRISKLEKGETVILNMNTDLHLLKYATDKGIYVRCDRFSEFGNPFILDVDGNRDEVCEYFKNNYLPFKKGILLKIKTLKGKALGCHCYPQKCHCETLKNLADETTN